MDESKRGHSLKEKIKFRAQVNSHILKQDKERKPLCKRSHRGKKRGVVADEPREEFRGGMADQ